MSYRLLLVPIVVTLILSGCGESKNWNEALNESSPPNPEQTRGTPKSEQTRSSQGVSADARESGSSSSETTGADSTPQDQPTTDSNMATIVFTLNNYPNCHNGAVRLYVNRKYVDLFDDQGKMEISISPGTLDIEVWDSGGKWNLEVNVRAGSRTEVGISCDDKQAFGSEGG